MKPMLAIQADRSMMPKLAGSSEWAFTQKLDGERVLISTGDLTVYGRSGRKRSVPQPLLSVLRRAPAGIILDGELMKDGSLWLFDAPQVELGGKVLIEMGSPYSDRLRVLGELVKQCWPGGIVRTIPYATSPEHKLKLFKALQENHAEGIVARRMAGVYAPGERSADMVKLKFTKTADVVVVRMGDEGKANLVLAVHNDKGELVEVGKVSALTADGPKVKVGDVIEVQYRHFSADGRMVEPVNPKLRTDKDASECREDQFVRVNTHKIGAE